MQRFMVAALAASMVVGVPATLAMAQETTGISQPTATGNGWLNENDFDYNRRHWTPPNHSQANALNSDSNRQRSSGYSQTDR